MYNYALLRSQIVDDQPEPGEIVSREQKQLLAVREIARNLIDKAGCVRMDKLIYIPGHNGDTWLSMARVDRLVEVGELVEIPQVGCMAQHRIFVKR